MTLPYKCSKMFGEDRTESPFKPTFGKWAIKGMMVTPGCSLWTDITSLMAPFLSIDKTTDN